MIGIILDKSNFNKNEKIIEKVNPSENENIIILFGCCFFAGVFSFFYFFIYKKQKDLNNNNIENKTDIQYNIYNLIFH